MHTENYYAVLDDIHQHLRPRVYLEIGTQHGFSAALALEGTQTIGVDPQPDVLSALPTNTRIERCTSDEFFAERAAQLFAKDSIDLAFIDGMHLFEYAVRDFANVERFCTTDSVILLHDCLPRSAAEASRERSSQVWAGDVWKVLYCLQKERPELDIVVINVPPTGLAIVQGLNPGAGLLSDGGASMIAKYVDLPFEVFEQELLPSLNVVGSDRASVRMHLPAEQYQSSTDLASALHQRERRQPTAATLLRRLRRFVKHSRLVKLIRRR